MKKLFKRRHWLALFLIAVATVPRVCAQQNPPINQETVLSFVHDLLQEFYPDLISKGHRLKLCVLHPADASWREISGVYFTVLPENPPDYGVPRFLNGQPVPENRPNPNTILLDGSVWLPPLKQGSRVQQLESHGENTKKLYDFLKVIRAHPEWSDDEMAKALKQAGARFGPDEQHALTSSVPWDKWSRFLGKLKVTEMYFRFPNKNRFGSFEAATMQWFVHATTEFDDGTKGSYDFIFEPFDGRLEMLSRGLE